MNDEWKKGRGRLCSLKWKKIIKKKVVSKSKWWLIKVKQIKVVGGGEKLLKGQVDL